METTSKTAPPSGSGWQSMQKRSTRSAPTRCFGHIFQGRRESLCTPDGSNIYILFIFIYLYIYLFPMQTMCHMGTTQMEIAIQDCEFTKVRVCDSKNDMSESSWSKRYRRRSHHRDRQSTHTLGRTGCTPVPFIVCTLRAVVCLLNNLQPEYRHKRPESYQLQEYRARRCLSKIIANKASTLHDHLSHLSAVATHNLSWPQIMVMPESLLVICYNVIAIRL